MTHKVFKEDEFITFPSSRVTLNNSQKKELPACMCFQKLVSKLSSRTTKQHKQAILSREKTTNWTRDEYITQRNCTSNQAPRLCLWFDSWLEFSPLAYLRQFLKISLHGLQCRDFSLILVILDCLKE